MKVLRNLIIAVLCTGISTQVANAQCANWNDSPKKEQAETAHVLYRQFCKGKQPADLAKLDEESFKIALDNWKIAYEIAPAADGKRPSHFVDGRKLFLALAQKETDEAKKNEHNEQVLKLYDEQIACYKNEAFLLGRKAYDMFYMPAYGYRTTTLDVFKKAFDTGGNDSEYILLEPAAMLLVYLFKNEQVDQQTAQDFYTQMEGIAEYNMTDNAKFKAQFEAAKQRMDVHFKEVEDDVFDCAYFRKKLVPDYKAKPDDLETIKYVYVKLKKQGCDDSLPIMIELKEKYEVVAAEINEGLEKQRRIDDACYDATQLQKEGKYKEALARYQECSSAKQDDKDALAQVYYSMASIQTWQTGQLSSARSNARKAADMKSDWGKPYILMGDIIAKLGRNCSDDWNKRLAIIAAIDKYRYAKSIDSEASSDANKRIGNYAGSLPEKQEGFMRGVTAGQSVSVGCGIGETVKVRFKD